MGMLVGGEAQVIFLFFWCFNFSPFVCDKRERMLALDASACMCV
jgi:hypothetical protein